MRAVLHSFLLVLFFAACKSSKPAATAAVAEEVKVPIWVSSRPNTGFKYVGIGFAEKSKGGDYKIEAKKAALFDLSSEIKTNISSNSVLYTVQNNNNFNENFNSLIKLSSTDNLEGYELVDSYENDKQYWVYYQLDKQAYAAAKAKKKELTITRAANLIASAYTDELNKDFSTSLKKRIQAFGVLTPYLQEEISFDATVTKGIANVFDLTSLIQKQLQSIVVETNYAYPVLKPYQQGYAPLKYQLLLNGQVALQNFPFLVQSDDDRVTANEAAGTDDSGFLQLKINSVEPVNQSVGFSLRPDVHTLLGTDSVGQAGLTLLSQFISTSSLKVYADVQSITVYIHSEEKNLGKLLQSNVIESFIRSKFNGEEIRLVDDAITADYIIDAFADTQEDISSGVLSNAFSVKLASLTIQLNLRAKGSKDALFKSQTEPVYGYANSLEQAGMNAYSSDKLKSNLGETLFFLKRKMLVY